MQHNVQEGEVHIFELYISAFEHLEALNLSSHVFLASIHTIYKISCLSNVVKCSLSFNFWGCGLFETYGTNMYYIY